MSPQRAPSSTSVHDMPRNLSGQRQPFIDLPAVHAMLQWLTGN
jgi:hypothetical protein